MSFDKSRIALREQAAIQRGCNVDGPRLVEIVEQVRIHAAPVIDRHGGRTSNRRSKAVVIIRDSLSHAEGVTEQSSGPAQRRPESRCRRQHPTLKGLQIGGRIDSNVKRASRRIVCTELPRSMPQSLAQIYLHIVFSTKDRYPWLTTERLQRDVHAYLSATLNNQKCPCLIIGGVEDHIHILCRLGRQTTIADLVRDMKKASSSMLHDRDVALAGFHWQNGYGAFSVSPSHVDALRRYIADQREHHRQETYQDEFRRLLKKYAIEYDERYVWD
jgi:putative transposase